MELRRDGRREPTATTAYQRLAAAIKEQIASGELGVGERLPVESELSTQYGVSRNTAREALRTLASQGLVSVRRGVGGGAFVTLPTSDHISEALRTSIGLLADGDEMTLAEITEVREMLEVPAAELAAWRRTDADVAAIRATLVEGRRLDHEHSLHLSQEFHLDVVRAAHNPVLSVLASPLFEVVGTRVDRSEWSSDTWVHVDHGHREILTCIADGDQAGAREATRAHLRDLRRLYGVEGDRQTRPPLPAAGQLHESS